MYPFFGCERYKNDKTMHCIHDILMYIVCVCVQDACLRVSNTFVHRFGGMSSDGLKFEAQAAEREYPGHTSIPRSGPEAGLYYHLS